MQSKALTPDSRAVEELGLRPRVSGTDALEAFSVAFELLNRHPVAWCLGTPVLFGLLLVLTSGFLSGPSALFFLGLSLSGLTATWVQLSTGTLSRTHFLRLTRRLWLHRGVLPGFFATSVAVLGVTACLAIYGLGIFAASLPLLASAPMLLTVFQLGLPLILSGALLWIGTSWFLILEAHSLRCLPLPRLAESS